MSTMSPFGTRSKLILLFLAGVALGSLVTGKIVSGDRQSLAESFYPLRLPNKDTPLVRPLVGYESPEATTFEEYASLKNIIESIIEEHKKSGVRDASVYYRNLETGRWIGINQGATYHPASLLKIPVMIAYYKQAEVDPLLLKTRITYKPITGGNAFETQSSLKEGAVYTTEELIDRMIIDSDNGATFTLLARLDDQTLREVYTDIGIEDPGENSALYKISTKTYALFFRILYNASYLSRTWSEKALELLSKTTYTNGLRVGIPKDVTAAHKFGEHVSEGTTVDGVELHDCGIVYHPEAHYLLCIMTHANDTDSAEAFIQDVSKAIYNSESEM